MFEIRSGASAATALDSGTGRTRVLAGRHVCEGTLGIPSQSGDRHFLQCFALGTRSGPYNATAAMRLALEHQNPLVTGPVRGVTDYPETEYSLLRVGDSDLLLWALKPAEEGIQHGIIARVWNLTPQPRLLDMSWACGQVWHGGF